jgi:hypothetical protein
MENPSKMDDLEVPQFQETSISTNGFEDVSGNISRKPMGFYSTISGKFWSNLLSSNFGIKSFSPAKNANMINEFKGWLMTRST